MDPLGTCTRNLKYQWSAKRWQCKRADTPKHQWTKVPKPVKRTHQHNISFASRDNGLGLKTEKSCSTTFGQTKWGHLHCAHTF